MKTNRLALTVMVVSIGALAVLFAGCKKDGEGTSGSTDQGPSKEEQLKSFTEKALPSIQAAIPADGPKLELEAKLIDKDRLIAAVPKGWEAGMMPGAYQPPKDAGYGFMTDYSAGSTCDGVCSPKDWKAATDDDFEQFGGEQFAVVKDEQLKNPAGRLMIATSDGGKRTYLTVARYKEGASRYYICRATLDEEAKALLPAFETACTTNVALFLR